MRKTETNGAYIVDSLGKILITHPTNHSIKCWSIPKGGYDYKEETSLEAAIRETWEETNLDLELFINKITYEYLGLQKYLSLKKTLNAHLFIIDLPLSEMDLNLWCKSEFNYEKDKLKLPENDLTEWVSFEFAEKHLHESQRFFLKNINNNLLASKIKCNIVL